MRPFLPLVLILAVSSSAALAQDHSKHQAAPKPDSAKMQHMVGPWKEMNDFHTLLAAAYHPVKEKKDLKPLRENADKLAAASRTWAASTPPAACASDANTPVVAISVDALAVGNQVMANASDAELTLAITALHAKFEAVEKKCGAHDMKGMKH